ncbi:MAG: hypothetical protein ACRENE_19955 [Polyangiaceae bacterium]
MSQTARLFRGGGSTSTAAGAAKGDSGRIDAGRIDADAGATDRTEGSGGGTAGGGGGSGSTGGGAVDGVPIVSAIFASC